MIRHTFLAGHVACPSLHTSWLLKILCNIYSFFLKACNTAISCFSVCLLLACHLLQCNPACHEEALQVLTLRCICYVASVKYHQVLTMVFLKGYFMCPVRAYPFIAPSLQSSKFSRFCKFKGAICIDVLLLGKKIQTNTFCHLRSWLAVNLA